MNVDDLRSHLTAHGQEHLLAFWNDLDAGARECLAQQIHRIDLALVERLFRRRDAVASLAEIAARAEPPPAIRLSASDHPHSPSDARRRGAEALAAGKLGLALVAGGQGTRLGFDHPKGMFPFGPVSGACLFQILIEKIVATSRRYGARVPLYLMTSPATDRETREFLARQNRFGLPEDDLVIFCQGTMPAVDAATGKILLADRGRLAVSPDGHGGMLQAMAGAGCLADMQSRGIEQLFYFQVDNPLAQVAKPVFLGNHRLAKSKYSLLAVAKTTPRDRVGNIVSVDGQTRIIEYSDLPDEAADRRNSDGLLELWAGSIAVHIFDVAFLAHAAAEKQGLPFHIARKKVPHVDTSGAPVEPSEPNAIQFEQFIFDLLPRAARSLVVEVELAEAFAPVKNAPGAATDTAQTSQQATASLHRRWLKEAGAEVADGVTVEISPLFALDADEVATKLSPGTRFDEDRYLC